MLTKLKNDYLIRNGFVEECCVGGREDYKQLSPEEKATARVDGDGNYVITVPKEVTSEEFDEILKIQMANDMSRTAKYVKITCGIVVSSFILSIIAVIYSLVSISSML